eukprot:CAMPEP_0117885452 /NCGR_PEP_ID=MMETSP0950-20121206/19653_1 /TAXON_ID=44440 /ORGANISM="Chattonella subsalsa, Strain CCMP2191" /LENGTH=121 /DNA_ID=CAMNT_0005742351 /DNA_START=454 /DNA_END=816 /DNA_ORIENTATION=+
MCNRSSFPNRITGFLGLRSEEKDDDLLKPSPGPFPGPLPGPPLPDDPNALKLGPDPLVIGPIAAAAGDPPGESGDPRSGPDSSLTRRGGAKLPPSFDQLGPNLWGEGGPERRRFGSGEEGS